MSTEFQTERQQCYYYCYLIVAEISFNFVILLCLNPEADLFYEAVQSDLFYNTGGLDEVRTDRQQRKTCFTDSFRSTFFEPVSHLWHEITGGWRRHGTWPTDNVVWSSARFILLSSFTSSSRLCTQPASTNYYWQHRLTLSTQQLNSFILSFTPDLKPTCFTNPALCSITSLLRLPSRTITRTVSSELPVSVLVSSFSRLWCHVLD